jgi:hypothetical protein
MRRRFVLTFVTVLAVLPALGQSNIDNSVPNKRAWGENIGWTNWRDANGGAQGVAVDGFVMSGFIWGENVGWINVGDGTPSAPPHYGNLSGADFGVNIDPDGALYGLAWGENIGWINFDGGALATPPQAARIQCDGRLNGYAWGENVGWINLSDLTPGKFVAVETSFAPVTCDMNHDGFADGDDIQVFLDFVLGPFGPDWRDVCSGDVEVTPDGMIGPDDIDAFVDCLLGA